jgi:hypothetical protein
LEELGEETEHDTSRRSISIDLIVCSMHDFHSIGGLILLLTKKLLRSAPEQAFPFHFAYHEVCGTQIEQKLIPIPIPKSVLNSPRNRINICASEVLVVQKTRRATSRTFSGANSATALKRSSLFFPGIGMTTTRLWPCYRQISRPMWCRRPGFLVRTLTFGQFAKQ